MSIHAPGLQPLTADERQARKDAYEWAVQQLATLDTVIAYMEATDEDAWQVDVVRSKDGTRNCFFGHLFNMDPDELRANTLWGLFEEVWATTYRIYAINDGLNPAYPQATPKQRILAFLRALAAGEEMTTGQSMEASYEFCLDSLPAEDRPAESPVAAFAA